MAGSVKKMDIEMNATIRIYLWGHESFTNTLKNDCVWDVNKYWELEIFLLNIIKEIENKENVDKMVMADVYYLGRSIETAFSSILNPYDAWSVQNIDIEELTEYYDRFTHIMRIFWGKIPLREDDYLLKENPLLKEL